MKMARLVPPGVAGCLLATCWSCWPSLTAQDRVTPIPVRVGSERSAVREVGPLMMAKLTNAQRVLEGLVTQDFERIASAAQAMKTISLDPPEGWENPEDEGDKEVYEHFRMEFMREAAELEKMAQQKNLAGAALCQQNLTSTCIACHDYIRDYQRNQ